MHVLHNACSFFARHFYAYRFAHVFACGFLRTWHFCIIDFCACFLRPVFAVSFARGGEGCHLHVVPPGNFV